MGTYSFLITTRNNTDSCKINWEKVNKEIICRNRYLQSCYEDPTNYDTLQKIAERLNETKFVGYLTDDFKEALIELNRNLIPYNCFPRIYYEYEGSDHAYCFEFIPGTENINVTICDYTHLVTDMNNRVDLENLPEKGVWNFYM